MGAIADHLRARGYSLPQMSPPAAFKAVSRWGDLVFVSGQISRTAAGVIAGPIQRLSAEQLRDAPRVAVLRALAALDAGLPERFTVRQILKLTGYLSTSSPALDPATLNAASELLVELYGAAGEHARTVLGVGSAPYNAAVTVELVVGIQEAVT